MFWFGNKKKTAGFEVEIHFIEEEISRSERFEYKFGVMVLEVNNSVPRGLSEVLPGKTISFHVLEKNLRGYDRIIGPDLRRYYVILPQTDESGVNTVKERLSKLSFEQSWGDVSIGTAVYPEHGKRPADLLDKATAGLTESDRFSKAMGS